MFVIRQYIFRFQDFFNKTLYKDDQLYVMKDKTK